MAEEKHRMLYQGQDPSQPVCGSQSQRDEVERAERSAAAATAKPQQPPTYDDAMGNHEPSHASIADRRCTFFAEPQQRRSQLLDEPQQSDEIAAPCPQLRMDIVKAEARPQQQEPLRERGRMQQVHSFFALAPQPKLGGQACSIVCPACGQKGRTRPRCTPNTRTHCWAFWLCSIGWCCCACLYPYLVDSCRNTNHYCAVCKTFVGSHNPKDCC
ncbi:uncharacterized protein LOC111603183 [Drosophila hydei]|uniref:Uncharacterized protein LOC111603183 n=1 Tax=Drosophila hydei TaxID=7224 RepID=A0A6J1MB15_DROHY|nr:uncharacterized protein LOC111603183 [Drosophila hydei]